MKKFLRFSLVSLLMMICGIMSAQTVTFDATTDLGTCSSSAGADQITKDGVTISISNGMLGNGAQYRVYKGQTITVASTVGNITKMVITCTAKDDAKYGPGNFTDATSGTYTYADVNGTWEGDAAEFTMTASIAQVRMTKVEIYIGEVEKTLTINGETPFTGSTTVTITPSNEDYAVYYSLDGSNPAVAGIVYSGPFTLTETTTVKAIEEDYAGEMSEVVEKTFVKEEAPEISTADNIAAFKALEQDTEAKLILNNAQVLYAGPSDIFVSDNSGAIDFYATGLPFNTGDILNGSVIGKFKTYNDIPELTKTDNTSANDVTTTSGTATPKTVTISQAKSPEYYCQLVKIESVQLESREEGTYTNIYATFNGEEIQIYNKFKIEFDFTAGKNYTIEGILIPYKGAYEIYPTQAPVLEDDIDPIPTDLTKAANIAEFKGLEDKTMAELKLSNAVVLYAGANDVFVRDESGAIDFYKTGLSFVAGQVMNGTIIGISTNYKGLPELTSCDYTKSDGYTSTTGTVTPKTITIAEAKSETYLCDLIQIEGVQLVNRAVEDVSYTYAYIGEEEIQVYDKFKVGLNFEEGETYTVKGILGIYNGVYEIFLTEAITKTPAAMPVCENISIFKTLETGTEAELKLTDAVVLYSKDRDVFVRDASGAIEFYNTGIVFENNQVINGSIIGKYSPFQGLPELVKTDNTNADGLTLTAGNEPQPVVTTIANVNENLICDLVRIENITLTERDGKTYAVYNDDEIYIFDKFDVLDENISYNEYCNLNGILVIYKGEYRIYPTQIFFDKQPGDVNHDGTVDITDVLLTVDYILGKHPTNFYVEDADVNDDEAIDVSDVLCIVDIILGYRKTL